MELRSRGHISDEIDDSDENSLTFTLCISIAHFVASLISDSNY